MSLPCLLGDWKYDIKKGQSGPPGCMSQDAASSRRLRRILAATLQAGEARQRRILQLLLTLWFWLPAWCRNSCVGCRHPTVHPSTCTQSGSAEKTTPIQVLDVEVVCWEICMEDRLINPPSRLVHGLFIIPESNQAGVARTGASCRVLLSSRLALFRSVGGGGNLWSYLAEGVWDGRDVS